MQYLRGFAALAALMGTSPALAQDADWAGLYGGLQLDIATVELSPTGGGSATNDGSGPMIGLNGGYRYDFGSLVLGATATLSFADFDTPPTAGPTGSDPSFGSMATVGVEAGYDLGEVLVYGELGHTWATRSDAGNTRRFEGGFQYGVGADVMLNEQIMIGGSISHTNLDDFGGSDVRVTSFGVRAAYRF